MKSLTLLLPLALASCMSPTARSAPAYVAELAPLLQENGLLAERVLEAAAAAHNGTTDAAALEDAWQHEITPLSEHLRDHAMLAEPPVRHADLVDLWSDRAEAYRALTEALADGDLTSWQAARATADQVKLREEEWFKTTNVELASTWVSLDQYP